MPWGSSLFRNAWSRTQRAWQSLGPTQATNGEKRKAEPVATPILPLERVVLTAGVSQALFTGFAEHRREERGNEEIGWLLLGYREEKTAIALACLPAGTMREASSTHVRFNTTAQTLGSIILRQRDKRLTILGVVHTHPGTLRHPSEGDFVGDSDWVRNLRGQQGVFAIGTHEPRQSAQVSYATQPSPSVQCYEDLRYTWYSLAADESHYAALPVTLTLGEDQARSLHQAWPIVETHAEALYRVYKQQKAVSFEVLTDDAPSLVVSIPLAEANSQLRVVLSADSCRYLWTRAGETLVAESPEPRVDTGIYRMLADIAAES